MDTTLFGLVARFTVLASIGVTAFVTVALVSVVDLVVAAIVLAVVGPAVHMVVGKLMMRGPEPWSTIGDHLMLVGVAYPLVVWIGGAIYAATTGSLALAALIAFGPLLILPVLLVMAVYKDPNRRALKATSAGATSGRPRRADGGTSRTAPTCSPTAGRPRDRTVPG